MPGCKRLVTGGYEDFQIVMGALSLVLLYPYFIIMVINLFLSPIYWPSPYT